MSFIIRFPHGLIRRYFPIFERLLVSAALAGLLFALIRSLPVYPMYWDVVIAVIVFGVTLWSPSIGYFLAVAAATYPLYTFSLYVAVLFLAIALLGHRLFIHNLGAAVLVLAAPWLSTFYLAWIVPVLGGLWWGALGGALMGGLAALWGQIIAGMAGLSPDWIARMGVAPAMTGIVQRFAEADSLETLILILESLAPDSTTLLHHLIQIFIWATVGGLVGKLVDLPWVQHRRPWGPILIAWVAALIIVVSQVAAGLWLQKYTFNVLASLGLPLLISFTLSVFLIGALESFRDVLEHPLPAPRSRPRRKSEVQPRETGPSPLPVPNLPSEEEVDQDKDDLIMLELD